MTNGGGVIFDILIETKKTNAQIDTIIKRVDDLENKFLGSSKKINDSNNSLASSVAGVGKALLAYASFDVLTGVGKSVLDAGVQFQKFDAILKNALGSQRASNEAMAMLESFATKTPESLASATDAFISLINSGIRPTEEQLVSLSDYAQANNKTIIDFVEAIKDAKTYQFERLLEFGIKTQTVGDKVKFTYRDVTSEVSKNSNAIQKYLFSLGQLNGIAGTSAAQMATTGGKISNMGDSLNRMYVGIMAGNKGFVNFAVDGLAKTITGIDALLNPLNRAERAIDDETTSLRRYRRELMDAETPEERRLEILKELKKEHPDWVKSLSAEADNIERIVKAIDGQISTNIKLLALESQKKDIAGLYQDAADYEAKAENLRRKFDANLAKLPEKMQRELIGKFTKNGQIDYNEMYQNLGTGDMLRALAKKYNFDQGISYGPNTIQKLSDEAGLITRWQRASGKVESQIDVLSKRADAYSKRYGLDKAKSDAGGYSPTSDTPSNTNDKNLSGLISGQRPMYISLSVRMDNKIELIDSPIGQTETEITNNYRTYMLNALNQAIQIAGERNR